MPRYTQEQVDEMPPVSCACGCGTLIPAWSVKRQIPRRFAQGHYRRLHKVEITPEQRQRMSAAQRQKFLDRFPDGLRQCPNCQETYELAKFYIRGKKKYVAVCLYCRRSADAAIKRASRSADPLTHRTRVAMKAYGITEEHARQLLSTDLCAICGATAHHIDHDHVTGKVRDRLCSKCNQGLGSFDDDPQKLTAAITYLAKHREIHQLEVSLEDTTTLH